MVDVGMVYFHLFLAIYISGRNAVSIEVFACHGLFCSNVLRLYVYTHLHT